MFVAEGVAGGVRAARCSRRVHPDEERKKIMKKISAIAMFVAAAAGSAQASITFSFADPVPGSQLSAVANSPAPGIASLSYDTNATINLLVDGTQEGMGSTAFTNARMEFTNMTLGAAVTIGGITVAPIAGSFTIYDFTGNVRTDIITGTSQAGSFVRVLGTNSLQFSTPDGFTYTAGPALNAWMTPGSILSAYQEASFSLTDVQAVGGGNFIGPGGVFRSFTANSSYSGNTEVIPAPGAIALAGMGGLLAARRRRA